MQSICFVAEQKGGKVKELIFRYWFFNCPLKFFLLDQKVFLMHFQSNQTIRCWVALVWDLKLIVWRQNLFWSELLFRGEKKKKRDNTFTIFWLQTVAFWFNLFYCLWCLRISEKIIEENNQNKLISLSFVRVCFSLDYYSGSLTCNKLVISWTFIIKEMLRFKRLYVVEYPKNFRES